MTWMRLGWAVGVMRLGPELDLDVFNARRLPHEQSQKARQALATRDSGEKKEVAATANKPGE